MERFPPLDFAAFHRAAADHVDERAGLALGAIRDAEPIAFCTGGRSVTYAVSGDSIHVTFDEDAGAATVVELSEEAFSDFAHELRTCFGLAIGEHVAFARGDVGGLMQWEPALRALWHGRPVYDDEALDALEGLDLSHAFDAAEDPDRIGDFLHRAGFVRVRGVFRDDEIARLRAEVDRLTSEATFDDGRSWWAKTADGADVCCRLIYAGGRSEAIAAAASDPRIRRLVDLAGVDVRLATDRLDGESVVIKHPGVVEGLADLPWHRDCSMGGHPVLCPGLNVGIQLDAATPENGQLHFLAGSWRSSAFFPRPAGEERLPAVPVTTEPGDVTVHFGHTLHAAPPPAGHHDGRRTLYATFVPSGAFEVVEPYKGYNDSVLAKRGRVTIT